MDTMDVIFYKITNNNHEYYGHLTVSPDLSMREIHAIICDHEQLWINETLIVIGQLFEVPYDGE